jgi:hypothetical protein
MNGFVEMLGLEKIRDPVKRLVVYQQRADQRLLGLDIMGREPICGGGFGRLLARNGVENGHDARAISILIRRNTRLHDKQAAERNAKSASSDVEAPRPQCVLLLMETDSQSDYPGSLRSTSCTSHQPRDRRTPNSPAAIAP